MQNHDRQVKRLEELYIALAESTEDYVFVYSVSDDFTWYSPRLIKDFNLPEKTLNSRNVAEWMDLIHPDDWELCKAASELGIVYEDTKSAMEYRLKNRRGEWIWLQLKGKLIRNEAGEVDLFSGYLVNLSRHNEVDLCTGLPGMRTFESAMRELSETAEKSTVALIFLAVDNFERVNQMYGHEFGDRALLKIAQELQRQCTKTASQLYRMDGDRFALLLCGTDRKEVEALYHEWRSVFSRQQSLDDKKYTCSLSAGCAFYPINETDCDKLLRFAELACSQAKREGKNQLIFFDDRQLEERNRKTSLAELLRGSVEEEFRNFHLVYQPLIHSSTGKVGAAEALLRWSCTEFGNITPDEFIPLLEQEGTICAVGKWVLEQAINACGRWQAISPGMAISINVSYRQMRDSKNAKELADHIEMLLKKNNLSPKLLTLELTESSASENIEGIYDALHQLRQSGVSIAMDDFGTGYSSLTVLRKIPMDVVKIDKSFVDQMDQDEFGTSFIQCAKVLCHSLNKTVCQEGIETEQQCKMVSELGIDLMQGYYFSRPVPEEDFIRLLQDEQ